VSEWGMSDLATSVSERGGTQGQRGGLIERACSARAEATCKSGDGHELNGFPPRCIFMRS
jgi:hypothetical protein